MLFSSNKDDAERLRVGDRFSWGGFSATVRCFSNGFKRILSLPSQLCETVITKFCKKEPVELLKTWLTYKCFQQSLHFIVLLFFPEPFDFQITSDIHYGCIRVVESVPGRYRSLLSVRYGGSLPQYSRSVECVRLRVSFKI